MKTKRNGGKKIAKKDLNKLSFDDLKKELEKLEKQKKKVTTKTSGFYQLGEPYMIRTVTMIYTGRLIKSSSNELVLTEENGGTAEKVISISFDDLQRASKVTLPDLQGEMVLNYISSNEVT